MDTNLHDYRKSYEKSELIEGELPDIPLDLFRLWFEEIEKSGGVDEVNAMTITSIGIDGFPKSRVVLLKEYDERGFVFYTNYNSEKGKAISKNNKVCISFFWPNLERQVIIKGRAMPISEDESTIYFQSRPRGSQLGAWASDQSATITSRKVLEEKLNTLVSKYENKPIPKPPYWGGYRVEAITMEFWQGRPNRLHDRIYYTKEDKNHWELKRLAP